MALPTVADLKIHLDIESTRNDAELTDHLDAAVAMVEGLIGPITTTTVTEVHYGVASSMLLLRRTPVADLLSISATAYSQFDYANLTVADYVLDHAAGVVRLASGGPFYGDVTVTYSVGRTQVPADIRMAILIIAGHSWETQRGTSPSALTLQGDDAALGTPGIGYAIPNRARDYLAPYFRSTSIA